MRYDTPNFILVAPLMGVLLGAGVARSGDEFRSRETIHVDLKLRTGGGLGGPVLDHTDHGLVVLHDRTPYVFAWEELEPGSAYGTKRALLIFERGGKEALTAEDHFRLGEFARRHGRNDLAATEFRRATRMDSTYRARINTVAPERKSADRNARPASEWALDMEARRDQLQIDNALSDSDLPAIQAPSVASGLLLTHRDEVHEVYQVFGDKVREVLGRDVELIESDHFMIWTDWPLGERARLVKWCESMFTALCRQFDLNPDSDIFPAKCPVFCWRSRARFERFAQYFDGYDGSDSIGYTRSIRDSGHVHVVLLRQGRSPADFDRFACTLVHEGTHAFMHRLYSSELIPHWVNEGFADLTAERVLGDRCPAGENASLLAAQIVRYDWPVGQLLRHEGPIEVYQYPVAHSVVAFLERRGSGHFAGFIRDLKSGRTIEAALTSNYEIETIDELERQWRVFVEKAGAQSTPPSGTRAGRFTFPDDR